MKRILSCAAVTAIALLICLGGSSLRALGADTPAPGPAVGYALHIDADQHFGDASPNEIAHHWCKTISKDSSECLLFDSDGPGARLVGIETIVPVAVWQTFPAAEQALWHYHKTELKKIHVTLPGLSAAEAAKVVASIEETYGKVWILWNPAVNPQPIGQPSITILK